MFHLSAIGLCSLYPEAWTQLTRIEEVDRISKNVQVNCFARSESLQFPDSEGHFWIINDSVYGLLHVPRVFTVCSEVVCELSNLFIPLVLREMNASRFQCVTINHQTNMESLGGRVAELIVITTPLSKLWPITCQTTRDSLLIPAQTSQHTVKSVMCWSWTILG